MEELFGSCVTVSSSQENLVNGEQFKNGDLSYDVFDIQYEPTTNFNLDIYGTDLSEASPVVLYIGQYGDQLWDGLKLTGSRLVFLPVSPFVNSHMELYKLACKTACYVFDKLTTGGVYIVGHGIGALLAAKLIANKELLSENSRIDRLQAIFLISGIYKTIVEDDVSERESFMKAINDPWLSGTYNFQLSFDDMNEISPLKDNFDHLWEPGTRCYIFSVENDDPQLQLQSRHMFNRLADSCDQDDMHYEVKDKFNRNTIFSEMCKHNNFLTRLIRYDIKLSSTR